MLLLVERRTNSTTLRQILAKSYLEAVGLITTGGLSAGGITIDVDPASKIGMSFLMIFGRLEIIAVIYIFYPRLAA